MVNFIQVARTLCIVASVAGLAGCSTRPPPPTNIAVIEGHTYHGFSLVLLGIIPIPVSLRHETWVTEIDGKSSLLPKYSIHVRPGPHSVRVSYQENSGIRLAGVAGSVGFHEYRAKDLAIDFMAVAGHEYRIPAQRWGERNWVWVEDTTTGKMVAGEKPPDIDEPQKN